MVSIGLLDVNMLIALGWTSHAHYPIAHRWFAQNRSAGWATCPITQCAFVRLSSNRSFNPDAVSPTEAAALLRTLISANDHEFWPDDISVDGEFVPLQMAMGYRQVSDAYLLGLAMHRGGKLVTLDKRIRSIVKGRKEYEDCLEIVGAGDL